MIDYEELASDLFHKTKEEVLDEDRHSLGVSTEETYTIDNITFLLRIEGYWEKGEWVNWEAYYINNGEEELIDSGTIYG